MNGKTNVQLVKEIMENSKYGALAQMFVMDALLKWSDIVSKSKPDDYKDSFVHGESWIAVAKEIKAKLAR
jgi:hypothetical protein